MAEWSYTPIYPAKITYDGPNVLVAKTADGREIRRVISADKVRMWDLQFRFNGSEMDGALDFFDARGFNTTFTAVGWDPHAVGGVTAEATVRFTDFDWEYYAYNAYRAKIKWREELT
jgi:hypothetical protein